jgi:hypothetical protein
MRLPFEQRTGAVGIRHDLCGVTGLLPDERDLEVDARDRSTVSITSSTEKLGRNRNEPDRLAAAAQIRERIAMRAHEIGHVNIISDAGAVRCRVVGAEDIHS